MTVPNVIDLSTVQEEVDADLELVKIVDEVQEDSVSHPKFSVSHR